MIRGSVDAVTKKHVSGWIYADGKADPVSVEAVINNQVVGSAVADMLRPDLAKAGFGEGKCGFEIRFKHDIDPVYLPFIQIRMAGTDLELRRWAAAGFQEYFRALYQRYPHSGRSASVFGGLWTDRTDASAVLKGRADIGLMAPADANCIARFIHDGAVVIARDSSRTSQNGARAKVDLPAAVGEVLFDEAILRVLRGILDDNPVAIRADAIDTDQIESLQISALEDLPSPAECLGLVYPNRDKATAVEVVRGSHRFPEFLPDGLSRWTHAAAERTAKATLSADLPVDRHLVPKGSALLIGPGALSRIRVDGGSATRLLVLPSRLSVLRFHQKPPTGELAHESGARIWV